MKMTTLWEAVFWAILQEPDYQFFYNEKKAAERMRKMGYLQRIPNGKGYTRNYPLGPYFPAFLVNRYKITKKGERALSEYRKRRKLVPL